jgi:uncharacterized repeat protein (TIGR01451 family)
MSKKAFVFGLFVAILASTVGGAFSATTALGADYIQWPGTLTCSPSTQWATSGQWVTMTAQYQYQQQLYPPQYQFTWSALGGSPSTGYGTTFSTQFWGSSSQQTYAVSVTDGNQTATCYVYINGYTTPTPTSNLNIWPTYTTIDSGQSVTFSTSGGNGSYSWYAESGSPASGWGSSFTSTFSNWTSYSQSHTVTVTSNGQSRSATVTVRPAYVTPTPTAAVYCNPTYQNANSGDSVHFNATGGNGSYSWTASEGSPANGWGSSFDTRFYNYNGYTRTYNVSVSSNGQYSTCSVTVRPAYWSPTPTPTNGFVHMDQTVRNQTRGGESTTATAYQGDRLQFTIKLTTGNQYTYNARVTDYLPSQLSYVSGSTYVDNVGYADGITSNGTSLGTLSPNRTYTVRFDATVNYSSTNTVTNSSTFTADLFSNITQSTTVYLNGGSWTPYPTPTVYPYSQLTLTQYGRNVTRGQSGEFTTVRARGNETLDLIVHIRNTSGSTLYNVTATDVLPEGFTYLPGTTAVNGYLVADGIAGSGLNIGSIAPYGETIVKLSVRVESGSVPTWGQVTTSNEVQVRADGLSTSSVLMTVYLGQWSAISGASGVKTGPADSLFLALAIASLVTALYAGYTRTDVFGRRMAIADAGRNAGKTMNFSR